MTPLDSIRLTPIEQGTVLDHLPVGSARKIIDILGLDHAVGAVTIAINTESRKMGRKDLLFIENREFSASDIARIALVAHGGTWNTVRNRAVIIKQKIELPQQVEGILSCVNPNCVTNRDHLPGRFRIRASPLSAKCWYCERVIPGAELYRVIR